MNRYLFLTLAFLNISAKRYLENRINTIGNVFSTWITVGINLLFLNIIFLYVRNLNGWAKPEVIFILGLSKIALSLFSALFQRSISFLPEYISKGNLDLILTKPVSSQFITSIRLTRPIELFNVLSGVIVCWYSFQLNPNNINIFNFLGLIIGLIFGIMILYAIYFMLGTLGFWLAPFNSLSTILSILIQPVGLPTEKVMIHLRQ